MIRADFEAAEIFRVIRAGFGSTEIFGVIRADSVSEIRSDFKTVGNYEHGGR